MHATSLGRINEPPIVKFTECMFVRKGQITVGIGKINHWHVGDRP